MIGVESEHQDGANGVVTSGCLKFRGQFARGVVLRQISARHDTHIDDLSVAQNQDDIPTVGIDRLVPYLQVVRLLCIDVGGQVWKLQADVFERAGISRMRRR